MPEIGKQSQAEDSVGARSLASLRSSNGSAVFKDHRSSISAQPAELDNRCLLKRAHFRRENEEHPNEGFIVWGMFVSTEKRKNGFNQTVCIIHGW
ncbi:unnamed protein product [Gongylonema pulchrum]|uniref:Uncharacterized protein n=1 Tax=Gongylonema pulchrum TaxID=637853 RepID=A0A183DYX1_9BILA|nr:unnamed protein product [Gongylonema pulchrum]